MLGIGLGVSWSKSVISFDPSTAAFISRVTAAGGTLLALEQTAINQLVVDLKAYGLWDSMKAIYPMVGASAAACAQNLKSSSFTGTFAGGWTFASTGVTPNGTSAYMDTGLNQSTNLTNTSLHCSYYANGGSFTGTDGSIGIAANSTFLLLRSAAIYFNQLDSDFSFYSTSNFGFYCGSRTSSSSRIGYYNGNNVLTSTSGTNPVANYTYYLGALNNLNIAGFFSALKTAFASIGTGLNATQAANFYIAVQAFQTTLNRNI
jgi:hypothetical protein